MQSSSFQDRQVPVEPLYLQVKGPKFQCQVSGKRKRSYYTEPNRCYDFQKSIEIFAFILSNHLVPLYSKFHCLILHLLEKKETTMVAISPYTLLLFKCKLFFPILKQGKFSALTQDSVKFRQRYVGRAVVATELV